MTETVREQRSLLALRQTGVLAVALVVAGLVTERLRPVEAVDRGIASTPFFWAIVVWAVVLLINAVVFDASQISVLEGSPLYGGLIAGGVMFVFGLVGFDAGDFGRRVIYLFANAMGAVMFWWGICSLGVLVARAVRGPQT